MHFDLFAVLQNESAQYITWTTYFLREIVNIHSVPNTYWNLHCCEISYPYGDEYEK